MVFVYGRRLTQTTRTNILLYGVAIDGKLAVHEDPVRALEPGETPDPQLPVANPDGVFSAKIDAAFAATGGAFRLAEQIEAAAAAEGVVVNSPAAPRPRQQQ